MSIIAFIIIGFLAGLIARALMPGNQSMGLVGTTILGMVGSLVGGLIGSLFYHGTGSPYTTLHPAGLLLSIVGALIVMFIAGYSGRGRRVHV
jgi:uncharacterized membrane protein YeaQ/YmgE (transglycosylase-associated protein family)